MQTVYADLLFLINFCMDFLCMVAVSKITSRHLSYLRASIGAAIGGAYSVVALFMPDIGSFELISALLCCIFMCLVVFSRKDGGIKEILTASATYFLCSALLGGIMTAVFNLLNSYELDLQNVGSNDIPIWLLISVGTFSLLSTYLGGKLLRRRCLRKTALVTVTFLKKNINFNAMYDSGNLLSDSISGRPVIVADTHYAKELLGFEPTVENAAHITDEQVTRRISLVPYATASGQRMMIAFRPDKTTVKSENKTSDVSALIGFANITCAVDGCTALIPPEL